MKPTLLDTSVIVALMDRDQHAHDRCVEAVESIVSPLVTCEAVIAESCHLLRKIPGASEAVIDNVSSGIFQIAYQLAADSPGVKQLLRKYRDRRIDLADACLIRLAEQFETEQILTLDSDFAVYRWRRNKVFRILPTE